MEKVTSKGGGDSWTTKGGHPTINNNKKNSNTIPLGRDSTGQTTIWHCESNTVCKGVMIHPYDGQTTARRTTDIGRKRTHLQHYGEY